jgi:general secretion pathway protein I
MASKRGGFTLVEVMVALLIVALALPALLMRIGGMATAAGHSRDVAIAYWVAENKLQAPGRRYPHGGRGVGLADRN